MLKIVLLGETDSEKSQLFQRWVNTQYNAKMMIANGAEFGVVYLKSPKKNTYESGGKMQIWDLGGDSKTLWKKFCEEANIIYYCANSHAFELDKHIITIRNHLNMVKPSYEKANAILPKVILVFTKIDTEEQCKQLRLECAEKILSEKHLVDDIIFISAQENKFYTAEHSIDLKKGLTDYTTKILDYRYEDSKQADKYPDKNSAKRYLLPLLIGLLLVALSIGLAVGAVLVTSPIGTVALGMLTAIGLLSAASIYIMGRCGFFDKNKSASPRQLSNDPLALPPKMQLENTLNNTAEVELEEVYDPKPFYQGLFLHQKPIDISKKIEYEDQKENLDFPI